MVWCVWRIASAANVTERRRGCGAGGGGCGVGVVVVVGGGGTTAGAIEGSALLSPLRDPFFVFFFFVFTVDVSEVSWILCESVV